MKLNNTYLVFNSGRTSELTAWAKAHAAIAMAIERMRWPDREGEQEFRIPRITTIKVGKTYTNLKGKLVTVRKKDKTLRNGVRPLRDQFRRWMKEQQCDCEKPLAVAPFFRLLRERNSVTFQKYPSLISADLDSAKEAALNESVGDLDFWFQSDGDFKTAVEWETGNISSSHRSINKLCLALMGQVIDAGVIIVPSFQLYPHLTDRIGNIRELQPYFYFWNLFGTLVDQGLLAVVEVEHDALANSTDQREFVPTGPDGNSRKRR